MHVEHHFTGSETVRDVVIGMSDGLTAPFALAAGLAEAVTNHWLIIIGGLAEIAAGSIAMGRGGLLAARSDVDSYRPEMRREELGSAGKGRVVRTHGPCYPALGFCPGLSAC